VIIDDIKIKAVKAYNLERERPHQKINNWIGYIISSNDFSIYHAGDTGLIPEMNNYYADIALVPVSGTYVMSPDDAIEAIKIINPQIAIPMHFDSNLNRYWKIFPGVGTVEDAEKFCDGIKFFCKALIYQEFNEEKKFIRTTYF